MASGKGNRTKIKGVQNTRKITKAMEMVAASKMRKAQDRMRSARPTRKRSADSPQTCPRPASDYKHPLPSAEFESSAPVSLILVTTDKGQAVV